MNGTDARPPLPLLAIVYGSLSLEQPLQQLVTSAQGLCRILWVLPFAHPDSRAALRVATAQGTIEGEIVDASNLSTSEAAQLIAAHRPDGITALIDETIAWTAAVAERLGLTFYTPQTAEQLTDKYSQRLALRRHGLPTPPFWSAAELAADGGLSQVLDSAEFPLVLKPRRGTSSKNVTTIGSPQDLRRALTAGLSDEMMVEGYIPDPATPCTGPGNAHFISVEIVVSGTKVNVVGVVGRAPLAEPFRESGNFFPADVSDEMRSAFARAAARAVRALGVTAGVLHVEVKCTDSGPVVIEVNGRPGGGSICDFLIRAYGLDLVGQAMRTALGEQIDHGELPAPSGVLFRLDVQPDARLTRLTSVDGIDAARQIAGVEDIKQEKAAGDAVSWRDGTFSHVAVVTGWAPDHAAMYKTRAAVLSTIQIEGVE